MEHTRRVTLSKRMSLALRHEPGRFGLTLDPAGWVSIDDFLAALQIDRADFDTVVALDDKQRFAVIDDRVRANQGHSVTVELGYRPAEPPAVLFHGTSADAVPSIRATGLHRGKRHHVHLSPDEATAQRVGSRRRGAVAILTIDAAAMARDGHVFYRSDNGVWLVEAVPNHYLSCSAPTSTSMG
ncbi:RNA 2'-phosphotransferase [Cryptosporangium sp. NPDC048952]|uniref:RNA 2'-phosphotransferase n=1 Tax=Cryptosporangium sp. NPDC048952 TaxID=3363961 RepID=UPI003710614B